MAWGRVNDLIHDVKRDDGRLDKLSSLAGQSINSAKTLGICYILRAFTIVHGVLLFTNLK